jgi:CheY-like chemotaxis protein
LQPTLRLITADASQIEQVIINLVVNARDAMPTGGHLTIETGNLDIDDGYLSRHLHLDVPVGPAVSLTVSDTGHGMNDEIKAHIFEPFFTTKEAGKGTGLGLATVYGIIKQSGGDIVVHSKPGAGTLFQMIFPASKAPPIADIEPPKPNAALGGNETILLVEDEEMVRNLAVAVLREKGYIILEANQIEQVLTLVEQHRGQIDLLLTDVVMPQMSGPQLAAQLKIHQPGLKVLFMSGYTDDTVVHHGLQTAQVEFLAKPFSPVTLAAKVRTVLDH